MCKIVLTQDVLTLDGALENLLDSTRGAFVLFAGCVRGEENGEPISSIRYETYKPMALKLLTEIAGEVEERFGARASILHRFGDVPVRGVSLLVACAAAHRAEAFQAVQWIVERIKRDAPIWKVDFTKVEAGL